MAMRLDGAEVIRRVINHPEIFPIASEINEIAQKLVVESLKATKISLGDVKAICSTLGEQHFKMVADDMSAADLKSVIGKIDKSNEEAKRAGEALQRAMLIELATGRTQPLTAVMKKTTGKKIGNRKNAEADAITRALDSKAMRAVRKRPTDKAASKGTKS